MSIRQAFLLLLAMSLISLTFLYLSQRHLTGPWLQLALDPAYGDILVESMQNSRELARIHSEREEVYKEQFERTQTLLSHLEILRANRQALTNRYLLILFGLVSFSVLMITLLSLLRSKLLNQRLQRLQGQLECLASGNPELPGADPKRDLVGRISVMIHRTNQNMVRAQQRLKSLEHLEAWQESLRRMAHEIRTPLTAIRLELKKLIKAVLRHHPEIGDQVHTHETSILEEMSYLNAFTDQYTSFAKIGKPILKEESMVSFVREFVDLYREAWPNLQLEVRGGIGEQNLSMDRRLVRQLLVNLCNNSSKAIEPSNGQVAFLIYREGDHLLLKVQDNGPGIDPTIRSRIFEPYTTTKDVGEGMGLGLSICKKIMLDHGGDLELDASYSEGAAFNLTFFVTKTSEDKA